MKTLARTHLRQTQTFVSITGVALLALALNSPTQTPRAIPAAGQARGGLKSKTDLKARLPIVRNRAFVLEPFHLTLNPCGPAQS